jgi:hypothetical protein
LFIFIRKELAKIQASGKIDSDGTTFPLCLVGVDYFFDFKKLKKQKTPNKGSPLVGPRYN